MPIRDIRRSLCPSRTSTIFSPSVLFLDHIPVFTPRKTDAYACRTVVPKPSVLQVYLHHEHLQRLFQSLESILRRSGPYAKLEPLIYALQSSIANVQTSKAHTPPPSKHLTEAPPLPTGFQPPIAPSVAQPVQAESERPPTPSSYIRPDQRFHLSATSSGSISHNTH